MRPKKRRRRSIQDAGSIRDGQHNVATGNQINNHGPLEDPKAKNEINNNSDNNDKAHTLRDLRELVARSEGDDMIDGKLPPLNPKTLGQWEISLSHVNTVVEKQRPNSVGRQLENRRTRLRVAAQEGIDPRSALGAVFRTNHKKGTPEGDRYAELDRQDASEFRRKWAAKQFRDIQEQKKVSCQAWARVDRTHGHYWSLGRMIQEDGGWSDAAAIRGALSVAKKCIAMGPPWVGAHPQTGRQVYLTLSFEYLEDFTHSWEIFQQRLNLDDVPATSPPPCPQVGAIATGVADEQDAGNLAPVTPHARENALEFDKVWRETQELRREFLSSWATAKKLRFQIADSVWTEAHKSRAVRTLDLPLDETTLRHQTAVHERPPARLAVGQVLEEER